MIVFVNGVFLTDELQCEKCQNEKAHVAITVCINENDCGKSMNICRACERILRREIVENNTALFNFIKKYQKK